MIGLGFTLEFINQLVHWRRERAEEDLAVPDIAAEVERDLFLLDLWVIEEEEQQYMEEVEHGWDNAWEDSYFGEDPQAW